MPLAHHPPAPRVEADEPLARSMPEHPVGHRSSRGQATAEYALVLLGAAAIALLLAAWAARSGRIGDLFDAVIDQIIGRVT